MFRKLLIRLGLKKRVRPTRIVFQTMDDADTGAALDKLQDKQDQSKD